jgi:hypothetical protein
MEHAKTESEPVQGRGMSIGEVFITFRTAQSARNC